MITVHGLHHVKVPVSDLTRSRAWYETVLSLSLHLEFPDDSGIVRGVAYHPLGNLTLCLREDPPRAQALAGFNPLAVLVATRADLDDMAAHLDQHGVSHGPVLTATLGWLLSAVDPDRIQLRFYTAERHPPMPIQGGGIAVQPIRPIKHRRRHHRQQDADALQHPLPEHRATGEHPTAMQRDLAELVRADEGCRVTERPVPDRGIALIRRLRDTAPTEIKDNLQVIADFGDHRVDPLDVERSPAWTARQMMAGQGFATNADIARWDTAIAARLRDAGPLACRLPVTTVVAHPAPAGTQPAT